MTQMDKSALISEMNGLLNMELEGVARYLHHSFMVFGWGREPLVNYFRANSQESLQHATMLGEKIVALGGHPEINVQTSWEPEKHTVQEMLESNLAAEQGAVQGYIGLLKLIPPDEIALEELVRGMVREEQDHVEELQKYVRQS